MCGSDAVHGDGRRVEPRCDAVWIGGFRLHRDLESVRGRGAGGHGCGGISARLQGVETSAGLHRVSDCLRADGIGCAVDLVIDLDVGGEESASTTRRRVLNELDDNIRRENAEIFREAFLELGLEGREVGVDGALRDRKLNLRLDRELNARDGDFTPIDVAADSGGDGGLDSRRRLRVHGVEAAETQSRLHLGFVGIPEAEEIDIALERAASRLVRLRSAITDDGIEVGAVRVAEDNFPYVVEAARALLPSAILVVACSALGFTVGSRAYSVLCRVLLIYVGAPLAVAGIRRIENVVGPRRVIWPVEALVLPIDQMIERVVYETMTCQGGAELTSIIADGGCGPVRCARIRAWDPIRYESLEGTVRHAVDEHLACFRIGDLAVAIGPLAVAVGVTLRLALDLTGVPCGEYASKGLNAHDRLDCRVSDVAKRGGRCPRARGDGVAVALRRLDRAGIRLSSERHDQVQFLLRVADQVE